MSAFSLARSSALCRCTSLHLSLLCFAAICFAVPRGACRRPAAASVCFACRSRKRKQQSKQLPGDLGDHRFLDVPEAGAEAANVVGHHSELCRR